MLAPPFKFEGPISPNLRVFHPQTLRGLISFNRCKWFYCCRSCSSPMFKQQMGRCQISHKTVWVYSVLHRTNPTRIFTLQTYCQNWSLQTTACLGFPQTACVKTKGCDRKIKLEAGGRILGSLGALPLFNMEQIHPLKDLGQTYYVLIVTPRIVICLCTVVMVTNTYILVGAAWKW